MPTKVPRHRVSLTHTHAEGERPIGAGGRKRHHKDDSDSNESLRPKSRRQKKNQYASAPPPNPNPPPSRKLPPEMKERHKSIIDSYAQKVNTFAGQPRADVYGERKKLYNEAGQIYGGWLTAKKIENRAGHLRRLSRNPSIPANSSIPAEAAATTSNASRRSTTSLDKSDNHSAEAPEPDTKACHPTKEANTVDVSPDCSTATSASKSSSTSTTGFGFLPSLPINITTHSCSFKCNRKKLPQECSVRGCKETAHKLCQHAYLEDNGIEASNTRPLRCNHHETMLLEKKAREKSNNSHPQLKCPPVLQPPVSTDHANDTSTSSRTIGCDWSNVVGGGCHCPALPISHPCGSCGRKTHHMCHVEYETKCGSGDEGLQVRCSHCVSGVIRCSANANTPNLPVIAAAAAAATQPSRNKGGRPKGTTIAAREEQEKKKTQMTDYLAQATKDAQDESPNGRMPHGTYERLHQEALRHFQLEGTDVHVSYNTIKQRIKRGNITVTSMGPKSPLEPIEPLLVEFVKQAQEAGQPITREVFVDLANSIIEGSVVEESLHKFYEMRGLDPQATKLSKGFYRGFMSRHDLDSVRGTRKSTMRMDDLTVDNLNLMYDMVYQRMVDAGVAVDLPEEEHYFIDREGNVTTDETKKFGEKCTQKIIHPEYCLHADEVGTDTCQEEDGHIGGTRYIVPSGMKAFLRGCKNSHRCTVFAITAATGEIVMYVIIFAAKELSFLARMGLDIEVAAADYDPEKDIKEQVGAGKTFPGAPKTTFNGKTIEAFVTFNEKGSMTAEIMASILKKIDDAGVFERTETGPRPHFLFDAAPPHLSYEVLKYANELDEFGRIKWFLALGLCNGTEAWQLGDTHEQNGTYKSEWTRAKDALMLYRRRMRMNQLLTRSDILPLLHRVFPLSFGRVETNRSALLRLGWLHMNRSLIHDPRVLQRATSASTSTTSAGASASYVDIDALSLNVSEGTAGMVAMDYTQQLERNTRLQEARVQQQQSTESLNSKLAHIGNQRISGGLLYKCGHAALDQEVLDLFEMKRQRKTDEKYQSLKKKAAALQKILDAYQLLLTNGKHDDPGTNAELKAWIGVRWKKGDASIPTTKQPLKDMKDSMTDRQPMFELKELLVAREHISSLREAEEFVTQYHDDLEAEAEAGSSDDEEEEEIDIVGV